jgi:hypothetical protein
VGRDVERATANIKKGGMKRKRSESMGNGLGMFEGYDAVVESMLLEWEVERQATPAGIRRSGEVADAIFNQVICHFERTREISFYKDRSLTFVRDDNREKSAEGAKEKRLPEYHVRRRRAV